MKAKKRNFLIFLAVFLGLVGCAKNQDLGSASLPQKQLQPIAPSSEEEGGAPWEMSYVAHCEEGKQKMSCPGAYGLKFKSDGTYRVGPGPEGQELEGHVSKEDYARIRDLYHEEGSKRRSQELSQLAAKYSPQDFPNPCADADAGLRKLHAEVQRCEVDADCVPLDAQGLPLERGEHSVVLDDCSLISRLLVGNAFRAVALQRELLLKREIVKKVCGKGHKPACLKELLFDPWKGAVSCLEGRCRSEWKRGDSQ